MTAPHRLGLTERRALYLAIAIALTAIVALLVLLLAAQSDQASDPFKARINATSDCDALISEYRDHFDVYRMTGSQTSKDEAAFVHQHAVDVGC